MFSQLKVVKNALKQLGPWKGQNIKIDEVFLKYALIKKINSLDWDDIKADVRKFLSPDKAQSLDIWSSNFFESKVKRLNCNEW